MFQIGHAYIINIEPKNLGGEGSAFWGFSPQSPPPPNAYTLAKLLRGDWPPSSQCLYPCNNYCAEIRTYYIII